jgi:hypothetical protein
MIIIRYIDSLRDGGSIVMKLWMPTHELDKYNLKCEPNGYVQIMIDYGAKSDTIGSWYNGLKYANGKIIQNEEFKNLVINEFAKKIEREQFKLNKLINERDTV